jgi:Mg-chelatase subunit ChlD
MLVPNRALKESIDGVADALVPTADTSRDADSLPMIGTPELPAGPVNLTTSLTQINTASGKQYYHARVTPPDDKARLPLDLVLVMDTSGSMGTQLQCEGAENTGLTVLALVEHACRTVVNMLSPEDRLGLVVYSQDAQILLNLTKMDAAGKKRAEKSAKSMTAGGTTNIWDGMKAGIDLLHRHRESGRNQAVLLLTDGQPTVSPPRGHASKFRQYKEEIGFDCSMFTFGFGYSLDVSEGKGLLTEVALEGEGVFGFIPDGSMVGKTFPSTMAEILTILARRVTLSLEIDTSKVSKQSIKYPYTETSWGLELRLGTLRNGQSIDVVFESTAPTASGSVRYFDPMANEIRTVELSPLTHTSKLPLSAYRFQLIDAVDRAIVQSKFGNHAAAREILLDLSSAENLALFPEELLADLVGEISLAVSEAKNYNRWGKYYLASLMSSHLFQICPNYKDPGIQSYGGKLSQELRELGDRIFERLPPPEVTPIPTYDGGYGRGSYTAPSYAQINMANINNGGCFTGEGKVVLENGQQVSVDRLKKGDCLANGAVIRCVVKTEYDADHQRPMVSFEGGLEITEWHPIRVDGVWQFPVEVKTSQLRSCPAVYTLVLDSKHFVTVSGVDCVTLGHGLTEGVLEHEYFGTQRVLDDLGLFPGWNSGLVVLRPENIARIDGRIRYILNQN